MNEILSLYLRTETFMEEITPMFLIKMRLQVVDKVSLPWSKVHWEWNGKKKKKIQLKRELKSIDNKLPFLLLKDPKTSIISSLCYWF